jgi:hypothetical protein
MASPPTRRRWFRLTLLGFAALFFAANGGKSNPGGPFISVMCDVLPVALAIYSLTASVRLLSDESVLVRVLAFVPMSTAMFAIVSVARNILQFWSNACARGPMIDF